MFKPDIVRRFVSVSFACLLSFIMAPTLYAGGGQGQEAPSAERAGDIYLLPTDPVSGASLAEVQSPVVIQHEGRELRFADQDSAEKFNADPGKYLPKVDEQMVKQQLPYYPLTTCPVSGIQLGGEMGDPVDIIYQNRLVRFCCDMCVDDFNKDPAKYLDKLDAAVIEAQRPTYPLSTCVVSGGKLGGPMGDPIEYVVGNRLVRFCCPMCDAKFNKNPLHYLAMIDEAAG